MLKVKNLSFKYGEKKVLEDISFTVRKGELCALLGPNGTGKTTIFKCCLNFLKFDGEILINGENIKNKSIESMAKLVAYVPQEHKPSFPYTVKEIVLMGRTPYLGGVFGISQEDKKKTLDALKQLGIIDLADKPYNQLSGGQKQLVLIARAVAQETNLMLLDEPTAALDFSNQIKVWEILQKLASSGKTIFVCTHDPNHVLWFCDRVIIKDEKGIVGDGKPHEVMDEGILTKTYGNVCKVKNFGGSKMIVPSKVT